ncbi:hypothetical protein [Streptomyces sp. NRRL S-1868]|uniref:hypothetical protein n=1 Tax=Streptomyces sp. NRRL S-1868 TaxID=1463892 RepID=UPI0004C642F6|nr:hypothetical protein [Streptomyces sp. NRRL S-1868]
MPDTITKRLHVAEQGLPEITYRDREIVTPEIITLIYLPDSPGPVNGIYPGRAEVEGPSRGARPGMHGPPRSCIWFYRKHPNFWPAWLIDFGAQHRP